MHFIYARGCPKCSLLRRTENNRLSPAVIAKRLKKIHVQMLDSYISMKTSARFKCSKNHVWVTITESVMLLGNGCPVCAGQRPDLKKLKRRLAKRGIEMLSTYKGAQKPARFRCIAKHVWTTTPDSVLNAGSGCLKCLDLSGALYLRGVSEEKVRRLLQRLTGRRFPKARPPWLRGRCKSGIGRELDGYSRTLAVAFEYQGIQHYLPFDHFGGDEALKKTKARDKCKDTACRRNGVLLIKIPYWKRDIETFLRRKLLSVGITSSD